MHLDLFQLLPVRDGVGDQEVIDQAWWEIDAAERTGFGTIWLAEHHLSSFGLVGAPSVFAAAIAQRTQRVGIGYAVAVVPLHHPVRLAEEIAWVDALSHGRVHVGLGPGFSPFEFAGYGIPLAERGARFAEGASIVRGLLTQDVFQHQGRYWSVPEVSLRPRPRPDLRDRLYRASSSDASLLEAADDRTPVLLALKSRDEIARSLRLYRERRLEAGASLADIAREVARFRLLRRVCVAETDETAWLEARQAITWENSLAAQVHEGAPAQQPEEALAEVNVPGACIGSPLAVADELRALGALGLRHVICWIHFGNMPFASVQRSMRLLVEEVVPQLTGGAEASRSVPPNPAFATSGAPNHTASD